MSHQEEPDGNNTPASLKRKRELAESSHPRLSPDAPFKAPRLTNGITSSSANASDGHAGVVQQNNESGDMLGGVGSATSSSSALSGTSKQTATSKAPSLANGFSPLTSLADSSPSKSSSPHQANAINAPNNASTTTHTSVSQQPRARRRPSIFPPAGTAKGYRVAWDPELDGRLSKEERKRAAVRRKEFGLEVRKTFRCLLSLRKITLIHCND